MTRSDGMADVRDIDMKVEVVVLPVADVDRAKEFYTRLGWRLDETPSRVVQLTPHGSPCSVQFGPDVTSAAPGSGKGYLVVSDIEVARAALVAAGAEVGRSSTSVRTARLRAWIRIAAPTAHAPRCVTPTATSGWSRRSPAGCRDVSTTPRRRSPR